PQRLCQEPSRMESKTWNHGLLRMVGCCAEVVKRSDARSQSSGLRRPQYQAPVGPAPDTRDLRPCHSNIFLSRIFGDDVCFVRSCIRLLRSGACLASCVSAPFTWSFWYRHA